MPVVHDLTVNHNKVWQSEELVNLVYKLPLQFLPGKSWAYSNTNYILLGMVLEKVFNVPIEQLIEQLISEANLQHTFYYIRAYDQKILKALAHGYFMGRTDQTNLNSSWLQAAGALLSTPSDMTRWMKQLLTSQYNLGLSLDKQVDFIDTHNGKKVSSKADKAYRFGLFRRNIANNTIYFTPGLTPGYISMMAYVPHLNLYFAYSVSKAPMPGFHEVMLSRIVRVLTVTS